jgi:hypothetical protein
MRAVITLMALMAQTLEEVSIAFVLKGKAGCALTTLQS